VVCGAFEGFTHAFEGYALGLPDGADTFSHDGADLSIGEAGAEPEGEDFALVVGEAGEGGADGFLGRHEKEGPLVLARGQGFCW